ncbi:MAG TPA: ABC transporter permease, partial [Stellaceae bacterium]|nr:ABC transporter permease [Stellaceae bacterium]
VRQFKMTVRPVSAAWRYRELIAAVLRRELEDRFSGSVLGWLWAIAGPLITVTVYLVMFTTAVKLPVASAQASTSHYALSVFAGLIVFGVFAELCCRGPVLLHEHAWFLKSSIFPSEILAWIALFRALTFAGVSLCVLLVFQLGFGETPQLSLLLLPLVILPLGLFLLGVVGFLAGIGAFTRDISYLMTTFVPLTMAATPVFYTISDMPPVLRAAAYLNPIGVSIEMMRAVVLGDTRVPVLVYALFCAAALAVFRAGYTVFDRYKGIALDAI